MKTNIIDTEFDQLELYTYSFTCDDGNNCVKSHAEDEKRFFRSNNGKGIRGYKSKPCWKKSCRYEDDSLLCSYAHNNKEARCYVCQRKGHYLGKVECTKQS